MNIKNNQVYHKCAELLYMYKKRDEYFSQIKAYRKIRKFQNSCKGEKCFIVGNGPSLQKEDLEMLKSKGYKTFASNRIYLIFPQTEWRPDYYFMSDAKLIKQYNDEMKEFPKEKQFFPEKYKEILQEGNFYHSIPFNYEEESKFSKNAGRGVYQSCSITTEMIQFAYFMGFKEIYLIGVDFNYITNNKASDHEYIYSGEKNYFVDGYLKPGEIADIPNLKANILGFMAARKAIEEEGKIIKNATRGGKLEVFERVNIDQLLSR